LFKNRALEAGAPRWAGAPPFVSRSYATGAFSEMLRTSQRQMQLLQRQLQQRLLVSKCGQAKQDMIKINFVIQNK